MPVQVKLHVNEDSKKATTPEPLTLHVLVLFGRRRESIMLQIRDNCAMVYLTGDDENRSNKRAPDSSKRGLYS